jgi:hypothetical protein
MHNQHWTIEQYVRTGNRIIVALAFENKPECVEVVINRQEFNAWLVRTDRLGWEDNKVDRFGDHQQASGCMSPSEYWDYVSVSLINNDLMEYIMTHNYDNIFESIETILKELLSDFAE